MGKLTVLVTTSGKLSDLLKTIAPLLSFCGVQCEYPRDSQFFRLPIDRKDKEAIYVYAPAGSENMSGLLLNRGLPIFHGQIIYLYELDCVLLDRNDSIRREKEELEENLMRIFHTKLIMNQSSLTLNEELESDIEGLATAFAKLVGDKKLISDGIKRLESMLKEIARQFLAFQIDSDSASKMMAAYYKRVEDLRLTYDDLSLAEDNHQAAIEVVQSKIQVMNSRTNMATQEKIRDLLNVNTAIQKKSLVFQYAAGLIEFIILAYYSLSLWSHFTPTAAEIIPSWIQVIFLMFFSGNTVLITHYLAEYMQDYTHVRNKLIVAGISLALIITSIILGTLLAEGH